MRIVSARGAEELSDRWREAKEPECFLFASRLVTRFCLQCVRPFKSAYWMDENLVYIRSPSMWTSGRSVVWFKNISNKAQSTTR